MKQKAFFFIFKGLSLKNIKEIFLEGESPTLKCGDAILYKTDFQKIMDKTCYC